MKPLKQLSSVFITIIMICFFSSCINGLIHENGNGKIIKQERKLSGFNAIEVSGSFAVILKQDSLTSVNIETDENLMQYITTKIEGEKLIIKSERSLDPTKDIFVYISSPNIKKIDLSGAVNLKSSNILTSSDLHIEISGVGKINLTLAVQSLNIDCSGAGEIKLKGKADNVVAETSGASEIKAFELAVENFKIKSSGAGEANVSVNKKLDIDISGAGEINYKGNPEISQKVSGAGSVHKE